MDESFRGGENALVEAAGAESPDSASPLRECLLAFPFCLLDWTLPKIFRISRKEIDWPKLALSKNKGN